MHEKNSLFRNKGLFSISFELNQLIGKFVRLKMKVR